MVFRKTQQKVGRTLFVTPANSTNRHLSYARIILNQTTPSVSFDNGSRETGLICLSGSAVLSVAGASFSFGQYDSIYIPRDSRIDITTTASVDFAEFSCDVEGRYPLQFVAYAEISKDPKLKFSTGKPGQSRHLTICLVNNVQPGRLLSGCTTSEHG